MTVTQPVYHRAARPNLRSQHLRVCRYIVTGYTARETADALDMTLWTVKDHLKQARNWLAEQGYPDTANAIRLRRALRQEGLIDDLELL